MQTWTLSRCMDSAFQIVQSCNSAWEDNHKKQNDRTVCTKLHQLLHSQQGLSQWKSHFPFGFWDVTPFTWMPARRTKYPFHSKCGRKVRLFPRDVFHPSAERVRQHSERFTNGYFFRSSSLFSCSISFETTGIAHLKNKTNPSFFTQKQTEGFVWLWLKLLTLHHALRTTLAESGSWPCAWNAELGAIQGCLRNALPGHLPSRSDQNKALYAGPLSFSHLFERGQPQVEAFAITFNPASAALDLSVAQWNRSP